jgi:hypothetical protein
VGGEISRLERLRYEVGGVRGPDGGDVQLWFGDGVVRLGVASEGETLRIGDTPWRDPFAEPLSSENAEYVASHGKWTLVDVSDEEPFRELIGKCVTAVMPLTNRFGRFIGVQLVAGDSSLNVYVHADELHVSWGADAIPRWGHEWVDDGHDGADGSAMGPDVNQETLRAIVGIAYPLPEDIDGGRRFLQRWIVRSEREVPGQDELDALAARLVAESVEVIREAYAAHVSAERLEGAFPDARIVRLDDRHCVVVIELSSRRDGVGDEDVIATWSIRRGVDRAFGIEDLGGLPKARWFELRQTPTTSNPPQLRCPEADTATAAGPSSGARRSAWTSRWPRLRQSPEP